MGTLVVGSYWEPAVANGQQSSSRRCVLQPLGPALPGASVDFVKSSLAAFYDFEIVVAERLQLPQNAYYPPRQRYRAEKILDYLTRQLPTDADRILGLTSVDISTTKGSYSDWGILGLASIDGRVSVLSSFRCNRKLRSQDDKMIRLGKVAVHELGHTLGLEHCRTPGCLMHDGEGSVLTVDQEYDLCPACRETLARSNRLTKTPAALPWPQP